MSKSVYVNGKFYDDPDSEDLKKLNKPLNWRHAEHERDWQRKKNYGDIVQPWENGKPNPDFVKRYPDRARDYFSDSELRDF